MSVALPIESRERGEFRGDPSKPVLFLDIDGVINAPEYRNAPAEAAVAALNLILAWPDVQVVISSAWRHLHPMREIVDTLESWGVRSLADRIAGATGFGIHFCEPGWNDREREILEYVQKHALTNWVAIDDSVRWDHRFQQVPSSTGMARVHARRALKQIGKPDPGPGEHP